ncbi:MAG: hypothetical protein GX456_11195 [Verrucomicrobia bacterium]|nr:hypothetical protein [Verrucomicrobiota bacterium]
MGVGRREALGVRQLAAALFLWPNNVPVPISASEGFLRRLGSPAWDKGQSAGRAVIWGQNRNSEPVTLSSSLQKAVPL